MIVRLMTFKSYFDHTEPIFSDLNIKMKIKAQQITFIQDMTKIY